MDIKKTFGSLIVFIIWLLYVGISSHMIQSVRIFKESTNGDPWTPFSSGIVFVFSLCGGLFTALVIAKLGVTPPGEQPSFFGIANESKSSAKIKKMNKYLNGIFVWIYMITWIVVGFLFLVYGVLKYPDVDKTIADAGMAWLGLAAGAGYSYFGIE